jgi:hypothetical protein
MTLSKAACGSAGSRSVTRATSSPTTVCPRIAEGFTEFTWNGRTGYGMTEYIERVEDGVPVGYPL